MDEWINIPAQESGRTGRRKKISGIDRMEALPERILALKCPTCQLIEMTMYNFSGDMSYHGRSEFAKAAEMARRHNPETHEDIVLKKYSHEGNGAPNGVFAGTLTKAPDWKETEEDMIRAMHKIMEQKTCPVEKYAWYVEHTENGLPHIHFIYKTITGGRIHQKVFKRYWKQWDEKRKLGRGHQGGYHKLAESETAYLEYIEKDGGIHLDRWTSPE